MKNIIKDEFALVTRPEEAAGATGAFGPERLQETVAHYRHQELVSWLKMELLSRLRKRIEASAMRDLTSSSTYVLHYEVRKWRICTKEF